MTININDINNMMKACSICPRECYVDRIESRAGVCGMTGELMVARAALHYWEEPCISGEVGSGTVFFAGCSMGCVYCQNRAIAVGQAGKRITIERLVDIFLELMAKGAANINLVTPTHFAPQILKALLTAKKKGLTIPIVYNSSGYEKKSTLKLLEGSIDIYLPDLKYMNSEPAMRYSACPDYFENTSAAIEEMVRQVGEPHYDDKGMLQKGVIVRHLSLPGYLEDSKRIIKYLFQTYGNSILISILNQYTPMEAVKLYPEINRSITEEEYEELVDYAIELGVENGFIQEGETASESFIPEFDNEGV